jgi:hypothetical protein
VESATAPMKSATAAVEPTATMKATTSMEPADSSATDAASEASTAPEAGPAPKSTRADKAPTVKAGTKTAAKATAKAASPPTRTPAPAVEPWAGSDEDPACEPVRSVIAVRRASVWIIRVITPFAHRGCTDITRANTDADRDLCLRIGDRHRQNAQQSQIP